MKKRVYARPPSHTPLAQIRQMASLPATHPIHTSFQGRRITTEIPMNVGLTVAEATALLEREEEVPSVLPSDIQRSLGLRAVQDFAIAASKFRFEKTYLSFEVIVMRENGLIGRTSPITVAATNVHEPDSFRLYLQSKLTEVSSAFNDKYAQVLLGVPSATVHSTFVAHQHAGAQVNSNLKDLLPHQLTGKPYQGFTPLSRDQEEGYCFWYCLQYHVCHAYFTAIEDEEERNRFHKPAQAETLRRFHEEFQILDFSPLEALMASGGIDVRQHSAQLTRFENLNRLSLCIWQWDDEFEVVQRVRECKTPFEEVTLLVIPYRDSFHFVHVKNPAYFLLPVSVLTEKIATKHTPHGCGRCGAVIMRSSAFEAHKERCRAMKKGQTECFLEGSFSYAGKSSTSNQQYFTAARGELRAPVCIYADFECVNQTDEALQDGIVKQVPASFGFYTVTEFASRKHGTYVTHTDAPGEEGQAASVFLRMLVEHCTALRYDFLDAKKRHELYRHEDLDIELQHENAQTCDRCGNDFESDKVLHHCHLSGRFLGSLCDDCNKRLPCPRFEVLVFFHNLNYDLAGILHALAGHTFFDEDKYEWSFECIGAAVNHLKTFTLLKKMRSDDDKNKSPFRHITFMDTFEHHKCGLGTLLSKLPRPTMLGLKRAFGSSFDLCTSQGFIVGGKSLFPYEYFTGTHTLDAAIPTRDKFTNRLRMHEATDDEWAHFTESNALLGLSTFRDVHDFYLKVDVIGLADFFENYRRVGMDTYGLDPALFLTAPSYAWRAMLKQTRVEFDFVADQETFDFLEKGKRGGVSMAVTRYARSNHPSDPDFDATQPLSSLVYLDANNLYGLAMSRSLPTGALQWLSEDAKEGALALNEATDYTKEGTGYFFEVDLEYPEELHDAHANMPLAPEKRTVREEELTETAKLIWGEEHERQRLNLQCEKLLSTLEDKQRYVVWGSTLRLYVSLGLRVTQVHRVLSCRMEPFLKPFIDKNTELRASARQRKDESAADFYKLMNNSVFGKTMENVRDRGQFRVLKEATDSELFTKVTSGASFRRSVFDVEGLSILECAKQTVKLDKPLYCGVAILDISKEHMYDLFYNHIHAVYGKNVSMIFTDTDSLCLKVTGDWYADCLREPLLQQAMDFSNYDRLPLEQSSEFEALMQHKGQLGYLKDECAPHRLLEAFAYRSKMHAELTSDGHWHQKCKGVPKTFVKELVQRQHWVDAAEKPTDWQPHRVPIAQIRTSRANEMPLHNLFDVTGKKRTISFFDDKRAILEGGFETLPYGHRDLKRQRALSY